MIRFDLHGVRVTLDGDADHVISQVTRDFSLFVTSPGDADIHLTVRSAEPPWEAAPDARCVMVKPGCVVYEAAGERWVDYQGRALCRFRFEGERGELWCRDPDLAHEITYLLLLSRVGEMHDRRGVHRVHALGLSISGAGILCLLPSGGGKTTLGLSALTRTRAHLLSDDTPLVTRSGDILGFPSRIGCVGEPPVPVDPRFLRVFRRSEHGPKTLVDADAFGDRIAWRAEPRAVVIGERTLGGRALLEPMPARRALPELFRSVVVGVGLPQVIEYFLRGDPADMARKAALVGSRALACAALLRRARTYRFVLGRDRDENAALLARLIDEMA